MLDYTISMEFIPGTNLSGDLACADWRFLLPSLCLGDAFCLGVPSVNSVYVLSKIARRLSVVSTFLTELRDLRGTRRAYLRFSAQLKAERRRSGNEE